MSDAPSKKRKSKYGDFWRAARFLEPYRKLVAISVICALFVGGIFTTGLGGLLPILQVLVEGDTVSGWVDRKIVEKRLGITLEDDNDMLRIIKVRDDSTGEKAGLMAGDEFLTDVASEASAATGASRVTHELAEPAVFSRDIAIRGKPPIHAQLENVPAYLRLGRRIAGWLPVDPVWTIAVLFAFITIMATIGNIVRFFQEHLSDRAAIFAVQDIRRNLYDHVLHIPLAFFGTRGTSDVTSRLVSDAAQLQDGFRILLGQSIQEPIKAAMGLGLALIIDWRLTLVIVAFAPVGFIVIEKLGRKVRRANREALKKHSSMLGQIETTLSGVRVVKSTSAERFERRRYNKIMGGLVDEQLKMSRYESVSTPVMEMMGLLVIGCVLMIASYMVFRTGSLKPVPFMMVMIALAGIAESLRRVSKLNNTLQRANAAAARLFETLDVPIERTRRGHARSAPSVQPLREEPSTPNRVASAPKVQQTAPPSRVNLPTIQREIVFDHVSFAYHGASQLAVDEVSLTVPKGKSIAVVGRNGSGKTTLLALLPRLYDATAGRILIDGVDIAHVTLRSLRRQITVVTQDTHVFPGTIAENIAYGHPLSSKLTGGVTSVTLSALRERIEQAAKQAFAHDFILEKPSGYDTVLDGLGGNLSGGQKQRLSIARAILRNAPILILDEATSQVDAESEHLIQQAIETLMHQATTFVIAHRFSTILSADSIVVMDRGTVIAHGKHDELLRTCDVYQKLYERQLLEV